MPVANVKPAPSRDIDVRQRLRHDLRWILYIAVWVLASISAAIELVRVWKWGQFGSDSHAYWLAWRGPMYTTGPVTPDWTGPNPYLYSPAFAQALWPASHLSWPLFAALLAIADAALLIWLLRPLGWIWVVPLVLAMSPEILSGNIFIPLAVMVVVGFRYPEAWAFSSLTKVAPTVMPLWWLVRREWRQMGIWAATTLAIVAMSAAISPTLWVQWITHLSIWAGQSSRMLGSASMVPLLYRAPVGLVLLIVGALRDKRWTVPVAALLCTPVFWLGSLAWLSAIPRVRADARRLEDAQTTGRSGDSGERCA